MRVKVYLHGHLREKVGKEYIETEAKSAYEALTALANRYRKVLKAPLDVGRWKVVVKNYESKEKLMGSIRHNVIHVYPMFRTAKSKWVTTIVGITLIVVGAIMVATGVGGPWGAYLIKAGIAITLSGLYQALFAPKISTSEEQKTNSKYLGTSGNTTAVGTRIPFGYGLYKVSGHFISYNVSSTNVKVIGGENS